MSTFGQSPDTLALQPRGPCRPLPDVHEWPLGAAPLPSPDTATADDLRRFQLHLVDDGTSPITLYATISGLKFFFDVTLDHPESMDRMQPAKVPRTLPVVLSREEVSRLIAAAWNLKHQTALSVACGADLRASEVISFKVRGRYASNRVRAAKIATRCSRRSVSATTGPCPLIERTLKTS